MPDVRVGCVQYHGTKENYIILKSPTIIGMCVFSSKQLQRMRVATFSLADSQKYFRKRAKNQKLYCYTLLRCLFHHAFEVISTNLLDALLNAKESSFTLASSPIVLPLLWATSIPNISPTFVSIFSS